MIQKVIKVHNVGCFAQYDARGDVGFDQLTLLSAENGRGKSTLCAILRSAALGDADLVEGRRRLGTEDPPEVRLLTDDQVVEYKDETWSQAIDGIEIFDSAFVHRNVFSGDVVEHGHRKNLYQIVLGEKGVELAEAVRECDRKSRAASAEIAASEQHLRQLVGRPIDLPAFHELEPEESVGDRLKQKREELARLARIEEVSAREAFAALPVPEPVPDVREGLARTLADLDAEALATIRGHMSGHTVGATEIWLTEGMSFFNDSECPFCGQDVSDLDLIDAYRRYFVTELEEIRTNVTSMLEEAEKLGTTWGIATAPLQVESNQEKGSFWSELGVTPPSDAPSMDRLVNIHTDYVEAVRNLVNEKLSDPLALIVPGEDLNRCERMLGSLQDSIQDYNSQIGVANKQVADLKETLGTADATSVQEEMKELELQELRTDPEVEDACERVLSAHETKTQIENEKEALKQQLDEYSEEILSNMEKGINRLLRIFNAGFRIADAGRSYAGGRPSSTYGLVINGTPVEVGDGSTPMSQPSFRNTLSSGDKSTLALAFFLARLELDEELSRKVVVLDDPFSSQDRARRACTQQQIVRLAKKAKQVVVLSHEPAFLALIWEHRSDLPTKTLQLSRVGRNGTTITELDISTAIRPQYFADRMALVRFLNDGIGEAGDIARKVRPVLEGFLRTAYPGCFPPDEEFGAFLGRIRDAEAEDPLFALQPTYEELAAINEYARRFHHPPKSRSDTTPINRSELEGYVGRTLEVVGAI